MICNKCGTENSETSKFCGACGYRLDGKILCNKCGTYNDKDNVYCCECGNRIDGKTICKNCGAVYEGKFCTACGFRNEERLTARKSEERKAKSFTLMKNFSNLCFVLGAIIALIFVFFVGVKIKFTSVLSEEVLGEGEASINLFYFFGKCYKDFSQMDLTNMREWWQTQTTTSHLLYNILGTLISAGVIVAVVSFAVITICSYVKSLITKTENKTSKWATATYVAFLTGSILFYNLSLKSIDVADKLIGYYQALNSVTMIGLIVGAIAVATGLVLGIIAKGKKLLGKKSIVITTMSVAGIILTTVVSCLIGKICFSGRLDIVDYTELNTSWSFINLSKTFMEFLWNNVPTPDPIYEKFTSVLSCLNGEIIALQLLLAMAVVISAIILVKHFGFLHKEDSSLFVLDIILVVIMIAILILSILANNNLEILLELLDIENFGVRTSTCAIVALVLSAVNLTCSIIRSVSTKTIKE